MIKNSLQQNILKLLTTALDTNKKVEFPDLTQWSEIKKELESHAILPLVSDIVMTSDINESEKKELLNKTVLNIWTFNKLMTAQTFLLNLLKDNNIPAAIMKGAASAQYYPVPSLRCFGDIDVLVLPEDFRRTFDLLLSSGYKNLQDYDVPYMRHIQFKTPDGFEIELHRYFSSSLNEGQNAFFDNLLYDKLKATVKIDLEGFPVSVFPKLENGLILLGHINQHLSAGLGLRQIIDWMLYVRKELDDVFWEEQFKEKAEAIGMAYLAKTVTKMCQMYLGLSPEITWCKDADESLAEELLLYIFERGNFGEKIIRGSRSTITVVHYLTNFNSAFRYLTKAGMTHMREAGFKPRKSIAWIYQIGHLLYMTIKRKDNSKLVDEFKRGVKEADFLKRLKVTNP